MSRPATPEPWEYILDLLANPDERINLPDAIQAEAAPPDWQKRLIQQRLLFEWAAEHDSKQRLQRLRQALAQLPASRRSAQISSPITSSQRQAPSIRRGRRKPPLPQKRRYATALFIGLGTALSALIVAALLLMQLNDASPQANGLATQPSPSSNALSKDSIANDPNRQELRGGLHQPWPWLQLRIDEGGLISTAIDVNGRHTVSLHHGRMSLRSLPSRGQRRLRLHVGSAAVDVLGSELDLQWNGSLGAVAVHSGRAELSANGTASYLEAGMLAPILGSQISPAMPMVVGQFWHPDQDQPHSQIVPIYIPAAAFAFHDEHFITHLRPDLPGGLILEGTTHLPTGINPLQEPGQAWVEVDLTESTHWAIDVLGWLDRQGASGFTLNFKPAVRETHLAGSFDPNLFKTDSLVWMPGSGGQVYTITPQFAGSTRIELVGYRPGFRIAGIYLRPIAPAP